MLGVRPADLRRLRDVRAGRHPLPGSRGRPSSQSRDARSSHRAVRRAPGIALATGSAPVTKALIALNVVIYLIEPSGRRPQPTGLDRQPRRARSTTAWMLFGPFVPQAAGIGSSRRCSSTEPPPHRVQHVRAVGDRERGRAVPRGVALHRALLRLRARGVGRGAPRSAAHPVLGASGAIFGILGAMLILEWQVTGRLGGQALTLIVINLVFSFVIPGTSRGRPHRRPDRR